VHIVVGRDAEEWNIPLPIPQFFCNCSVRQKVRADDRISGYILKQFLIFLIIELIEKPDDRRRGFLLTVNFRFSVQVTPEFSEWPTTAF
jgi:hypothetical protein